MVATCNTLVCTTTAIHQHSVEELFLTCTNCDYPPTLLNFCYNSFSVCIYLGKGKTNFPEISHVLAHWTGKITARHLTRAFQ